MNKNIDKIIDYFEQKYGTEPICFLDYTTDFELLFATMLSAQCTDDRVNMVTKTLFKKYKTLEDYANADIKDLENTINSISFYKNKAKYIKESAKLILKNNSTLPNSMEELTKLPGVGRKTANLIMAHIFQTPSVIVDTHVARISNRLNLTTNSNPDKIEKDLKKILPVNKYSAFNHQAISFGREICNARNPKCSICKLKKYCSYKNKKC